MRVSLLTLALTVVMMSAAAFLIGNYTGIGTVSPPIEDTQSTDLQPIETIFLSLEQATIDVPVQRNGSGGALTSFAGDLIVMTHEGEFFDVTGDTAEPLDIAPPANGWEAMLAFEQANPEFSFAHFYFRFNDIDIFDGQMIASFTQWVEDQSCYRTSIATAPLGGAQRAEEISLTTQNWRILFSTEPCLQPKKVGRAIDGHMAGGRFTVSADRRIYLAAGDYAVDGNYAPEILAQDPTQLYGKVIAIDLDTGIFEVVSQGHSNPQGIVITDTGEIYAVEHGRRGGDELNRIEQGKNYG